MLLVCYSALILYMGCQVYSETVSDFSVSPIGSSPDKFIWLGVIIKCVPDSYYFQYYIYVVKSLRLPLLVVCTAWLFHASTRRFNWLLIRERNM